MGGARRRLHVRAVASTGGRPALTIDVRPASVDDAPGIARVHVASWRWAYRGQLPDDVLERLDVGEREAVWSDVIASDDDRDRVLVAEERPEDVIGFASIGATRDDDAPHATGELFAIYLTEGAAGSGAGAALLATAVEGLADGGFTRATLWVLETNARARRFYEREGWAWDGTTSAHQVQCSNLPIVRYWTQL